MIAVLILCVVSLFICCAIAYILGLFWFSDMRNRRLRSFFTLGVVIFFWTLLNAITMVSDHEYFPVIYTLRMSMVASVPFATVWFILNFTNSSLSTKIWVRNLFIILPVIDILFLVTNPLHYHYFINYNHPLPDRAPIFWFHMSIDSFFILVAFIIIIRYIIKEAKRNPLLILTGVGMLIPYIINTLFSFKVITFPHDLTPIGFFCTFSLFVYVAYRSQIFNIKTALFSSTMDTIEDLIVLCNEDKVIMDINKHGLEIFSEFQIIPGRTKLETFFIYLDSIITDENPSGLIKAMAIEENIDGECTFNLSDGRKETYTINWRTVYERNKKSGYILLWTNVSHYREMIFEINNQKDELLELKMKADAANNAKSNFLANMSHEIRTPLNAITGMTSIAKSTQDHEKINYALEKIEDASAHLLGVINDILDMSKIEANKLELSPVIFNFEEMIQKIVNIINFPVIEKHLNLEVNLDKNIPRFLKCDDQRLGQVITNLLSNAVKFTPEHGSINFRTHLLKEENNICEIEIRIIDSGVGISEEQKARLFTSFGQAESGTTRKYGGTGLGLAISKRIVEMMGGRIWVTSRPGRGSIFSFTIQAEKAHDENNNVEDADTEVTDCFEEFCILLVEDMEINREIVTALLEPTLIKIECAENGREALKMFTENSERYDMIFMDLQMPEMDGYEATRRIRALNTPKAQTVPIVAMTANVFREDIEKCLEAGMDNHLGKPLDFDQVRKILQRYLVK